MNFESAYKRLQEIYSIINNQEIVDLSKLTELQTEADKLYEFLQSVIKKENSKDQEEPI